MGNIILGVSILLAILTFYVSISIIIETRRRYYNDYIKRKRKK
jgi:hypothetical protein